MKLIYLFLSMSSSLGKIFKLTTFGESHGVAIGGVIDGCPSGFKIDLKQVQNVLNKRRPGNNKVSSKRIEYDSVNFLSGLFEGKTLGSPIAFYIKNKDVKSKDYSAIKNTYRPSHADYTYQKK